MMPEYYEFYNPVKILSGRNAISNIAFELQTRGVKNPIILGNRYAEKIKTAAGCGVVFSGIPADSSVDTVNKAAKVYRGNGCDSLIAVGGGSVLDTAKGLSLLINLGGDDLLSHMGVEIADMAQRIPFIAVPTTAGTGSEVTEVAVIKDHERGIKMEFISSNILPHVAVLDPEMTISLPAKNTASTGMDALTHAIEAYTCSQKNPVSDAYAFTAIKLISENLIGAVEEPSNENCRMALANASLLAGCAFSNSMVGIVHAIGHAAGGVSGIPHGDAMSILMSHCMRYNMYTVGKLYGELLLPLAGEEVFASTPKAGRGMASVKAVEDMLGTLNEKTGLATRLSEDGVTEGDLPKIAQAAINDGAMICNPRAADTDDVMGKLKEAY